MTDTPTQLDEAERNRLNPSKSTPLGAEDVELREKLAAIEHERWADWQRYIHSVSDMKASSLNIPMGYASRWDRQINTPYSELSEREKQSDREQVDRYWHLVKEYAQQEANRQKLEMLGRLEKLSIPITDELLGVPKDYRQAVPVSAIQKEKERL